MAATPGPPDEPPTSPWRPLGGCSVTHVSTCANGRSTCHQAVSVMKSGEASVWGAASRNGSGALTRRSAPAGSWAAARSEPSSASAARRLPDDVAIVPDPPPAGRFEAPQATADIAAAMIASRAAGRRPRRITGIPLMSVAPIVADCDTPRACATFRTWIVTDARVPSSPRGHQALARAGPAPAARMTSAAPGGGSPDPAWTWDETRWRGHVEHVRAGRSSQAG